MLNNRYFVQAKLWGSRVCLALTAICGFQSVAQAHLADESITQQRIDNVRHRLLEMDQAQRQVEPEAKNQYLAQWYNWPNWPNWGNWGNWPNYWMNY